MFTRSSIYGGVVIQVAYEICLASNGNIYNGFLDFEKYALHHEFTKIACFCEHGILYRLVAV